MQSNSIPDIQYDLIVIGGGPSGMMCAGRAAELGANVLLLERNAVLGEKLSITGGARCNITNAEFNTRKYLENYGANMKFLHSPFSQFAVQDTFNFFEKRGLPLVVQARKRAFPHTEHAPDVTHTLVDYLKETGVKIETRSRVLKILEHGGKVAGVQTKRATFGARAVVIATGGVAAPETGSTGDGFSFLKMLGHTIHTPNPNIVPLTTDAAWVHRLSGVTWSFLRLKFIQNGKTRIKKTGKILFTHFGISGPLVLNSAQEVVKLLQADRVVASLDLFPDTEINDLDKRIVKMLDANKRMMVKNALKELLPEKLLLEILRLPHIDIADMYATVLSKEKRSVFVHTLKDLQFEITGTLGLDKAVVADGGVAPEEIDFTSMQSRRFSNLYVLGDVLHINRPTGGYSLQLSWTTGWVAGSHAAKMLK